MILILIYLSPKWGLIEENSIQVKVPVHGFCKLVSYERYWKNIENDACAKFYQPVGAEKFLF